MINRLTLLIIIIFIYFGCKNLDSRIEIENDIKVKKTSEFQESTVNQEKENFKLFIENFVSDSVFRFKKEN